MGERQIVYLGVAGSNPVAIATQLVIRQDTMTQLTPPPSWMHPLPQDPPARDDAFDACVTAYQHHDAPTHVCRQCMSEEMEARIVAAARQAQNGVTPKPEDFGQIYFEHPGCVGGEETIKLFLPHGLKTMLNGVPPPGFSDFSYPEVLDTTLKAGFWFWSPKLVTPVRALAARLFWDWFRDGEYTWLRMPHRDDDLIGPGDDIMQLCIMCLIDPADLIAALTTFENPQSDEALSIAGGFTLQSPFYFSYETGQDSSVYKTACDRITETLDAREAQAALHYVTPDWLRAAFWRHDAERPDLAAYMSKYENYYDIETVQARKAAAAPMMRDWPDLPII